MAAITPNPILNEAGWKNFETGLASLPAKYKVLYRPKPGPVFKADVYIWPTVNLTGWWGEESGHLHIWCRDPGTELLRQTGALLHGGECTVRANSQVHQEADTSHEFHIRLPPYPNPPPAAGTSYMENTLDIKLSDGKTEWETTVDWWKNYAPVSSKVKDLWKSADLVKQFYDEWKILLRDVEFALAARAPQGQHFDLSRG